jgi:hypothetical protein
MLNLVIGLVAANLILERHVLPIVRLRRQQVKPIDCGALGMLGLKEQELADLLRHPTIRRGRATQAAHAKEAGRQP